MHPASKNSLYTPHSTLWAHTPNKVTLSHRKEPPSSHFDLLTGQMSERSKPNILVTGTPGTGKTSLCEQIARETGFQHINVGVWVKDKGLHSGWDEEFGCHILDDDKVGRRNGLWREVRRESHQAAWPGV